MTTKTQSAIAFHINRAGADGKVLLESGRAAIEITQPGVNLKFESLGSFTVVQAIFRGVDDQGNFDGFRSDYKFVTEGDKPVQPGRYIFSTLVQGQNPTDGDGGRVTCTYS